MSQVSQEIKPVTTGATQEQANKKRGEAPRSALLWDLRQENTSIKRENQRLQAKVDKLTEKLAHFEKPVEGQVPSDIFVGIEARNRIAATASRFEDRRSYFGSAIKVRSVAEASKAIVKERRGARKQNVRAKPVVCDVCPRIVELPGEYEIESHFNSAYHTKWAERQVKANLFLKAQKEKDSA